MVTKIIVRIYFSRRFLHTLPSNIYRPYSCLPFYAIYRGGPQSCQAVDFVRPRAAVLIGYPMHYYSRATNWLTNLAMTLLALMSTAAGMLTTTTTIIMPFRLEQKQSK